MTRFTFAISAHCLRFALLVALLQCAACISTRTDELPPDIRKAIEKEDVYEDKVKLQEEVIRRQEQERKRQDNELQDVQRQQYYNQSLKRYEQPAQ